MLKGMIKIERIVYPKNTVELTDSQWAIVSARVLKLIEGEVKANKYGTITLKGLMPPLRCNQTLYFEGEAKYDNKYSSFNYEVLVLGEDVDVSSSPELIRAFLFKHLKTDEAVISAFNSCDVANALENKDMKELQKIKGIGVVRARKIIEDFHKSKSTFKYTSEMAKWGVTPVLLNKLHNTYGQNTREIYEKVKLDPYILANKIKGIGFKKADEIALKMGIEANSKVRMRAFITYYLSSEAESGKAYVHNVDLMSAINENIGQDLDRKLLRETIYEMNENNELWWSDDKSILASPYYRDLEKRLAEEIKRLNTVDNEELPINWKSVVEELEEQQGWKHSEEQLKGIAETLKNNFVVVSGLAGCVDCDTEFFNGKEWRKISEYQEGDMVLQYNLDGTSQLVEPYDYIKLPCDTMTHLKTISGGINQVLSDEHRFIYRTEAGYIREKLFKEVKERHLREGLGFTGRVITTFKHNGEGIDLTDEQIRVMLMVFADGSFNDNYRDKNTCRVQVKKERKVLRARKLLQDANIDFKEVYYEKNGYTLFTFKAPFRAKTFSSEWYKASQEQLQVIADEVLNWDGSYGIGNRKSYSTTIKTDADFIQFVFSAIGKRTTLNTFDRVGELIKNKKGQNYIRKTKEYIVTIANTSTDITFKGDSRRNYEDKGQMTPYKTLDGYKYCFSVPSTMLVLRREGRIFITGNSGKTTVSNAVTKILIDNLKKSLEQTALSGRASQRLAEVTGKEAKTIHRLLKFNPNEGFLHHKGNQLDTDVVIIDEASMIDTRLFLNLLEAIKTGTKVIVLGDYGQLSSIGLGQVLSSLIQTNIVKVIKLSTVYRQGKTSAINHQAIEIRNGNQLTHRGFEGRLVFGELKDFQLIAFNDRDEVLGAAIEEFKKHLDIVGDIMQVQVCTATRTKGNSSAYMLNRMIKNLYNPIKEGDKIAKIHLEGDKNYYLTEGDKIIVTKNDYKAKIWNSELQDYEEGSIYNGCIGKVFRISDNDVIVDIEGIGYVKVELNNLTNIELGYAVSVFKLQGSQYHTVIIPLDFSAYTLLNRQLVYTAITRASKHCVLVCENNALIKATSTNEVSNKHTFLDNFLVN